MLTIAGGILIAVAVLFVVGVFLHFINEVFPEFWGYLGGCIGIAIALGVLVGIGTLLYWWISAVGWAKVADYGVALGAGVGAVTMVIVIAIATQSARDAFRQRRRRKAIAFGLAAIGLGLIPFGYAYWRPDGSLTFFLMMVIGILPAFLCSAAARQAYDDGKRLRGFLFILAAIALFPLTFAYLIWRIEGMT